MPRIIKNKELQRLLDDAGMGDVLLIKDTGNFYVDAKDGSKWVDVLTTKPSTGIYVASFKQLSPAQWLDEIKSILK